MVTRPREGCQKNLGGVLAVRKRATAVRMWHTPGPHAAAATDHFLTSIPGGGRKSDQPWLTQSLCGTRLRPRNPSKAGAAVCPLARHLILMGDGMRNKDCWRAAGAACVRAGATGPS